MRLFITGFILTIFLSACREPYHIPASSNVQSLLVVEGNINSGQGSTLIKLSRTASLSDLNHTIPESNGQITIEGPNNTSFLLAETEVGGYSGINIPIVTGNYYRMRIKTAGGKEYMSDSILAINNPPIDSINWRREDKGVRIFANTHDPLNNTRYYRWQYDETWEVHSHYFSILKYVNGQILPRNFDEAVYICWKYGASSTIVTGSSARLKADVIFENPLVLVPEGSEKISVRYSILVRQYALTKKAFDFFQLLKQNSESIGSFFDAQPSEISGNIHNTSDPLEKVIGMVTISPEHEKRIFIDNKELAKWNYTTDCSSSLIANNPESIRLSIPFKGLPYDVLGVGPSIVGYYISQPICVDCTAMGGSLLRPSYW